MEALRQSLIPRRISRLYADTKRSYEQMIAHTTINAAQTVTHTKLRIQKDRLFAWGLEWADSNAAPEADIDGSLDRAGISDLVESIMSCILDLLERADSIQPQRTTTYPGAFPNDKPGLTAHQTQWSTSDLSQLSDIVKDLTASIDTLCDLSRSRQALSQSHTNQPSSSVPDIQPGSFDSKEVPSVKEKTNLYQSTQIWEALLHIPNHDIIPATGSSPPSYESVATSSEDRILAFMNSMTGSGQDLKSAKSGTAVLLEYVPVIDVVSTGQHLSPAGRYEELMQVEPNVLAGLGPRYLGTLKLRGWVEDTRRARNALVYEIPLPGLASSFDLNSRLQNLTLLSFLHHGADTDSTNMPSLEDRFRLAFNLASSLLHLHARGLLHRNINSRNVIFFTDEQTDISSSTKPWKKGIIRRPFLTSFDQCSEDVYGVLEEPFVSNIYRHPQSERGRRSLFRPQYDMYSLGLILLEIGLWMPISKLWKPRYTRTNFKSRLQTIYTRKLAGKCGSNYMKVVDFCLKAGDEDASMGRSGKSASSKSDIFSTTNDLYWKAFKVLERCCMIDDFDESVYTNDVVPDQLESLAPKAGSKGIGTPADAFLSPNKSESTIGHSSPSPVPAIQAEPAQSSMQKKACLCKVWSHDIPAAFASHWQQSLEPKLNRMFSKIIDRWESYSIELFMAGETAEAAKPTIYMVCASVEKARKVLQYVNQDKGLFDIKVSRGQILRSKAGKKKKRGKGKGGPATKGVASKGQDQDHPRRRKHYQERPTCGASIGAYLDEQHLPPVSFGGTVLVDGEPYGMSVHHMLENDDVDMGLDDNIAVQRSMARVEDPDNNATERSRHHWDTTKPPEALYPFEISDDEDEGYRSGQEEDDSFDFDPSQWDIDDPSDLQDIDMGDTPGIEPGQGEALVVTQPAIDDVDEGFFPNDEDVDEDHLASHTLGYIHASSGIRRTSRGAISHEVDWALIKIRENRKGDANTIAGATRHCTSTTPNTVIDANQLGGRQVHALGRTSGLQTGTILPNMVMVKLPGRVSHSWSWQVKGGFGMGGDSGAWVIDSGSGGVCACVLAWSEGRGVAFVAPMEVLLEDMEDVLGVKVGLLGQEKQTGSIDRVVGDEELVKRTSALRMVEADGLEDGKGHDLEDGEMPLPNWQQEHPSTRPTHISRDSTSSPPIATSPSPPPTTTRSSLAPIENMNRCLREAKRKSGGDKFMDGGEGGLRGWRVDCG
ncbi:MAG: hypothetical protein Q9174_004890 [Haloplaca sp. 1 TL-2023]